VTTVKEVQIKDSIGIVRECFYVNIVHITKGIVMVVLLVLVILLLSSLSFL